MRYLCLGICRMQQFDKAIAVIWAGPGQHVAEPLGIVAAETAMPAGQSDQPLDVEGSLPVQDLLAVAVQVVRDGAQQARQLPGAGVQVLLEVGVGLAFLGPGFS